MHILVTLHDRPSRFLGACLLQCIGEECVICKKAFDAENPKHELKTKGSNGINKASDKRGDSIQTRVGDFVHENCRRTYTNVNTIKSFIQNKNVPCEEQSLKRKVI